MTDNKEKVDALVKGAKEVEADFHRHNMEETILATIAQQGRKAEALFYGFIRLDWTRTDFRAIAEALKEIIFLEGKPVDLVILQDKLKAAPVKVGEDILKGIFDNSKDKGLSFAEEYIRIMEGQDRFRRAEAFGREYLAAVEKAKQSGDPVAAVAELQRKVFDLTREKNLVREYPPESEAAAGLLADLAARRTDGRAFLGLDCGFKHLNEVFNGLTEGVFVLAGAPSCGKTTLAKQIADHVAQYDKVPVLFWSFEQSGEELRVKSLARRSTINSRAIWKGQISEEEKQEKKEWKDVERAAKDYRDGEGRYLTIIEAGREDTLDHIRAAAVMAKHKAGEDKKILVIIDYLQIIPAGKDALEDIRAKVDWHLSELRRLSREIKSPVLVISSENREGYKGNLKPSLAALKESGGIEYTADGVICLWWNKDESKRLTEKFKPRTTIRVEAFVLKNRNGELAKIQLNFTPAWALFEDMDKENLSFEAALEGKTE